jgi:uncharacterized membrane protein YadS
VAFAALMVAANVLALPEWLLAGASWASGALLLTAIAAIGLRSSAAEMGRAGLRSGVIPVACTLALLGAALLALPLLG